MKIQILGTGCPKCTELWENAKNAAEKGGFEYRIEKISDINEIMKFGVMITPALAIDGEVKSSGKLLSEEEIGEMLK